MEPQKNAEQSALEATELAVSSICETADEYMIVFNFYKNELPKLSLRGKIKFYEKIIDDLFSTKQLLVKLIDSLSDHPNDIKIRDASNDLINYIAELKLEFEKITRDAVGNSDDPGLLSDICVNS